jgi:ligand-binding sensor protein
MHLSEIISIKEWEALEDEIRNRSGLNASVFNTEGIRITDNQKWPNRLCPEIKANAKGKSFICASAHMNLALQAQNTRQYVIESCDAGFIKMVVPIFIHDEFLGAVGACGLLLEEETVDEYLVNKITGIEESTILDLSCDICRLSNDKINSLRHFVEERLNTMLSGFLNDHSHS